MNNNLAVFCAANGNGEIKSIKSGHQPSKKYFEVAYALNNRIKEYNKRNPNDQLHCEKFYLTKNKNNWHNVKVRPTDLPDTLRDVEVLANMFCKWDNKYRLFHIQMRYDSKIMYGKPRGWGVSYPYDFNFGTDEVLAWKEIETVDIK